MHAVLGTQLHMEHTKVTYIRLINAALLTCRNSFLAKQRGHTALSTSEWGCDYSQTNWSPVSSFLKLEKARCCLWGPGAARGSSTAICVCMCVGGEGLWLSHSTGQVWGSGEGGKKEINLQKCEPFTCCLWGGRATPLVTDILLDGDG